MHWIVITRWLMAVFIVAVAGQVSGAQCSRRLEDLTTDEVRQAIAGGCTTAIIATGGTEQNGPHMVLGKHNAIAAWLADALAAKLGNAIVYPIVPVAPAGDPLRRTGHMAYAGSISLRHESFRLVVEDLVLSALAAGFRRVLLMGDHGEGQEILSAVAGTIDPSVAMHGVRVRYLAESYAGSADSHGGREDVLTLLAATGGRSGWVRGAWAGATDADIAEGRRLLNLRVDAAITALRKSGWMDQTP